MPKDKVAITLDHALIEQIDELVARRRFRSRSQAIELTLREALRRLARLRLSEECRKMDPVEERAFAEAGLAADLARWPEY